VQEAHDTAGTQSEAPLGRGRSWLTTAALAIVAIAGIVAGAIIFTMNDGAPDAPPTSSNSEAAGAPTLTDQEAIDRYFELEDLIVQAYRNVDVTLLARIYTPDSPTAAMVRSELNDLQSDSAQLILDYQTQEIEVVTNSATEIVLRQEAIATGRLRPVGDVKVHAEYHDQRRVVRITLRYQEPKGWLIHRGVVTEAERL
jgi:hypothetical protein